MNIGKGEIGAPLEEFVNKASRGRAPSMPIKHCASNLSLLRLD
jgi:hypothetical protein